MQWFSSVGHSSGNAQSRGASQPRASSVVDFDSQPVSPTVVPGLEIEVCSGSCEQALPRCDTDTPTPTQQCYSVASGDLPISWVFDFPYGFANATVRFTAPGFVALDYALGGPMIGAPDGGMLVHGLAVPMFSEAARAAVHSDLGLNAVDPARGMLIARTLSCLRSGRPDGDSQGSRAAGLKVDATSSDAVAGAVAFRIESSLLASRSPIETAPPGLAGFASVPPGVVAIETQTPGGLLATAARVRPNVITIAELRPGLGTWGQ